MDPSTEKLCFEEISHSVIDANEKINITNISNNWNVSFKDSETILLKWLKMQKHDDKTMLKEYLIRGVDSNGNCVISVVPEQKLDALEKICPKYTSSLYSIELNARAGKRLNIAETTTSKLISLPLKSDERKCKVFDIVISPPKSIKKEPEPIKKPFNSLFNSVQKKEEVASAPNDGLNCVHIKEEVKSPKKVSPKKKEITSKVAKVAIGKSSISSFFTSEPTTSALASVTTEQQLRETRIKVEKIKIENEKPSVDSNSSKITNKRAHSDANDSDHDEDAIPGTPQEKPLPSKKKVKLESVKLKRNDKAVANRSRLMQICDLSSDEDTSANIQEASTKDQLENNEAKEATMVKKEKENKTPPKKATEQMEVDQGSVNGGMKKRRHKTKRMVTKTYEDEDGYINTIREMEEVSCSEDDIEIASKASAKIDKKTDPILTEESSVTAKGKKKISPSNGKKQGTILSFFSKK